MNKIKTEILYYTGYQLEHMIEQIILMLDGLDVKEDSTKQINEIIRRIDIYSNSSSQLIKI